MTMSTIRSAALLLLALAFGSDILRAQGVTTGSLAGVVRGETGEPLPGANVVVVHEPTGTRYGASARATGAYNIPSMRIGGPYTVTASLVGYKSQSKKDVYVSLGQEVGIDFRLVEQAVQGEEVL